MISPLVTRFSDLYTQVLHTGSRVICDPPPVGTDDDYLVLVSPENVELLAVRLMNNGWILGGSLPTRTVSGWPSPIPDYTLRPHHEYEGGLLRQDRVFHSWVNGEVNLIVTANDQYFEDFHKATLLARRLNLTSKIDRVNLFNAVIWDVWENSSDTNLVETAAPATPVQSMTTVLHFAGAAGSTPLQTAPTETTIIDWD